MITMYGAKRNSKGQLKFIVVNHEAKTYSVETNGASRYKYNNGYLSIEITSINKAINELNYHGYTELNDY